LCRWDEYIGEGEEGEDRGKKGKRWGWEVLGRGGRRVEGVEEEKNRVESEKKST
jgi:hypothetical protein